MKKIVIVVAVTVVALTGIFIGVKNLNSGFYNKEVINNSEKNQNDKIESGDSNFGEDIENYKISDGYSIDLSKWESIDFNLYNGNEAVSSEIQQIISDNAEVDFRFEVDTYVETSEYNDYEQSYVTNLKIYTNHIEHVIPVSAVFLNMGLIDLDENDNYKEIFIEKVYGIDAEYEIYRIKQDGLELIGINNLLYNEEIKKYLAGVDTVIDGVIENPIMGYYLYEQGEFKYINKFPNGEEITNASGDFNENFQKQIFTVGTESSGLADENNYYGLSKAKVRFIRKYIEINELGMKELKYDIEVVEDYHRITYLDNLEEQEQLIPAGTIIKGVTSWSNAGGIFYNLSFVGLTNKVETEEL